MTMGSRIRQLRQARGLSQRQLAGEEITRNMLSALEHDAANPSLATLRYLARRLEVPVSSLLAEGLPDETAMARAREAYRSGQHDCALEALDSVTHPAFHQEKLLLRSLATMALAEEAIREQRLPYARTLLERAAQLGEDCLYFTPTLGRQWQLLWAKAGGQLNLPSEDEALLLRAKAALAQADPDFALRLLEAAQLRDAHWHYLRAEAHFARREFPQAVQSYHAAESHYHVASRLEDCYREQEDYKMAYFYAKKKEDDR